MQVISLHIPKTAGTTFLNTLQRAYGADSVALDYDDVVTSPESSFQRDFARWHSEAATKAVALASFAAVHGHFWAGKYLPHFPQARKILWLRDPAMRVVSLYHFWKTAKLPRRHPTQDLLLRDKLSLLAFAELPEVRNQITRCFVRDYRPEAFDFIGLQETFAEDLDAVCALLNSPKQRAAVINATPRGDYVDALTDASTLDQIRRWNGADLEWYEAAAAMRAQRQTA